MSASSSTCVGPFVEHHTDLVAFSMNIALTFPYAIYILAVIPGTGWGDIAKAFDSFTKVI